MPSIGPIAGENIPGLRQDRKRSSYKIRVDAIGHGPPPQIVSIIRAPAIDTPPRSAISLASAGCDNNQSILLR